MGKPFQFSIGRMLCAMACFCVAAGAAAWCVSATNSSFSVAAFLGPLLLGLGAFAAAIGLLSSRQGFFVVWSVLGSLWFLFLLAIFLACLSLPTHH
jgi:hypothetical protein